MAAVDPPTTLSRRSLLRMAMTGAAAAAYLPLMGCSSGSGAATTLRFYQSKPEVIGYFDQLIERFNSEQPEINVTHDATSSLVASLVREAPHDLVLNNYDFYAGTFVARGVLTDLGDLPEAQRIDPSVQALVGQYATPEQATNVLPYSITAAGVIYNQQLFEDNGVEVPTTFSALLDVCETFRAADITPIYSTFRDPWTIRQGLFDYMSGGTIDVADFFTRLKDAGPEGGSGGGLSFRDEFEPVVANIVQLLDYTNDDAASRGYGDGNTAFAQGGVAMLLQGPWAIGEIAKVDPNLRIGTFPLPATDDEADLKVRVNLDLALWIPAGAASPDAARTFLSFLMTPEIQQTYNADNLAVSPIQDAPAVEDERIAGLGSYVREGQFYQGAGTFISETIPLSNYLQELVFSRDGDAFLSRLDADWNRLAQRSL